jgi:hypothetical protein
MSIVVPPTVRAITTAFNGPTNHRGARVTARTAGGDSRTTVGWDYAVGIAENHVAAATALANKLGWPEVPCGISGLRRGGYLVVFGPAPRAVQS